MVGGDFRQISCNRIKIVYQHLSTKYRDFLEIARLLKVDIKNLLIESDANKQYSQFIEIIWLILYIEILSDFLGYLPKNEEY